MHPTSSFILLPLLWLGKKASPFVLWAAVGHHGAVALPHVLQRRLLRSASPLTPRTTVFANGSLLITQVKARSTGVYKCIGHGQKGKALVLKATLRLAGEVLVMGWAVGLIAALSLWSCEIT